MSMGFGIYVGWLTLGVWENHRNRSKSSASGPKCRRVIGYDDGTSWRFLQIASINSEIRSKVIAENEDGEKLWEVWGEDNEGKSHLVIRVLGRRDGLGILKLAWCDLWSVNGVQVLNFGQALRVGHESFPEFWAPIMIFAVETGGFQPDGLRSAHRLPLNIRWNVTPSIISHYIEIQMKVDCADLMILVRHVLILGWLLCGF